MKIDESIIFKAINMYRDEAVLAKNNAGYGGFHHDGGYSVMIKQIVAYKSGLRREVPTFLEECYKEAEALTSVDTEYQEYQRLKQKFEK